MNLLWIVTSHKKNEVNSITKPINQRYDWLKSPMSDLFGVEEGTKLDTHTVTFPSIDIHSTESQKVLFRMDQNSLTLCKLMKPDISQETFCYTVKTRVTSFGYEMDKDIPWTVLFYSHERGLNLDVINSYFSDKNRNNNVFHLQCNYKNKLLTTLIKLPDCDWYNI